jgi:predicted amidohydrolase
MKSRCLLLLCLSVGTFAFSVASRAESNGAEAPAAKQPPGFTSRANAKPRKVVIGTAVADFSGSVAERLKLAAKLLDAAARNSAAQYAGKGLDLMVFPEFALCRETGATAAERAVSLPGPILDLLGAKAREHQTWIIVPMTLREEGADNLFSNAAVLLNRAGHVAGIFRKVHPIADDRGVFEGGVTPGRSYPVFDCDFGRLGILICWDMAYEEAWNALAAGGAELVALPSASPQNLRPMAQALRHHYYVVNSAPRDNASVFDPIGRTVAQATAAPGVLVQEIDLSYAILHWSETLHEGRALTAKFGSKAGFSYSEREDTGVFWSNDPQLSIGAMIRELGLHEMPEVIEEMEAAREKALQKK